MNENEIKKIYLLVLIIILFISIYIASRNLTRGVICSQNNNTILCKNLALVDRHCVIFLENTTIEKDIKSLSEIRIENEILVGWYCQ